MSSGGGAGLNSETTKGGPPLVAPDHPPSIVHVVVGGPIDPSHPNALCLQVDAELSDGHPDVVVADVSGLADADIAAVDALARACLAARRAGSELRLAEASPGLRALLELAGLAEAIPCEPALDAGSGLDAERHPEGREEALRVQEERDPADPAP
jgi:anti-anti-sigma regulatory factor